MNPETARKEYLKASRLYLEGQYAAALVILDALDRRYPRQRNLMLARAHCLAKLFRPIEAVVLCDRILGRHECPEAHELKMRLVKNDGIPDEPEDFAAVPLPEPDPFFREPSHPLPVRRMSGGAFWAQFLQIGGLLILAGLVVLLIAANFGLVF